jgi:hypothetical protein
MGYCFNGKNKFALFRVHQGGLTNKSGSRLFYYNGEWVFWESDFFLKCYYLARFNFSAPCGFDRE